MSIRVPSRSRRRKYGYVRLAPQCPEPISPSGAIASNENITFEWTASPSVTHYQLYLKTDDGEFEPYAVTTETSYVVDELDFETTFNWYVNPGYVGADGEFVSYLSCIDPLVFTTPDAPVVDPPVCPVLGAPSGGSAFNVDQVVTLNWSAAVGADYYNVYIDHWPEADWPFGVSSPTTLMGNTSLLYWEIPPLLVPASVYGWRITAVNDGGESTGCSWKHFFTGAEPPGVECEAFVEGFSADPKSVRWSPPGIGYSGNTDISFSTPTIYPAWQQGVVGHATLTYGAWGATTSATGCQATTEMPSALPAEGTIDQQQHMPASGSSYTMAFPALTAGSDFVFSHLIAFARQDSPEALMTLRVTIAGVEVASVTFDWLHADAFAEPTPSENPLVTMYFRVFFVWVRWTNGQSAPDSVNIESINISNVKDWQEP